MREYYEKQRKNDNNTNINYYTNGCNNYINKQINKYN